MRIPSPIELSSWISENRDLLKPPVGNKVLFENTGDFIVMLVGGPNARKDFHVNQGEELFYQLEGEITLELMEQQPDGKSTRCIQVLKAGEIFLLPAGVPHGPRRPAGSVGLVVERKRRPEEMDAFQWYCENCQELLHEARIAVSDVELQLKKLLTDFFENTSLCTCKNCGAMMQKP